MKPAARAVSRLCGVAAIPSSSPQPARFTAVTANNLAPFAVAIAFLVACWASLRRYMARQLATCTIPLGLAGLALSASALAFAPGTYTGSGYTVTVDGSGLVSSIAISTTIKGTRTETLTDPRNLSMNIVATIQSTFPTGSATAFAVSGNFDSYTTYDIAGSESQADYPYIIKLTENLSYYRSSKVGLWSATESASRSGAVSVYHETLVNDAVAPVVTSFVVPSISNSFAVPISSFAATDTPSYGIVQYMVTESSVAPSPTDSRWSATPPSTYLVFDRKPHLLNNR